ncbi:MAG: O-antigen ligase family protein [Lentisphaeria bacterium]|nr:O-antigen ligase family protein [Lentisphaeria bacterium]
MPNEESTARGTMTAAVFIFLAVLLVCPGMLLCVPSWSFRFFETGTIVLATAGAALLFPQRVLSVYDHLPRGLLIAGGILLGIGVWHGLRHAGQYSAAETGELFLTVAVPFAVCVFARELKRLLPWYLTLFWLIDAALGFVQYYGLHWFLFGLPGNINWNAAFLAVTAPFAILTAWKWCPTEDNWSVNSFWRIGSLLLVTGVTVWQIVLTDSRGTLLGVAAAGALWVFLKLGHRGRRLTLFAVLALALVGSVWFAFFTSHDRILENLSRDERVFLANTTMSMIAEQPEIGFGAPSFEQEYLNFRRPEFFSMRHSAVRIDHPHNHLLYIAASFGILGLLCWLYLMLEPMFFAAKRIAGEKWVLTDENLGPNLVAAYEFRNCGMDDETRLSLLCLAGLLVHAQFDLVLFRWPTNLLAMVFLGFLIHEREGAPAPFWRPPVFLRRFRWEFLKSLERTRPPEHRHTGRLLRPVLFTFGFVLLGTGLVSAFGNLAAESLAWHADNVALEGRHADAARLYLMAASMPGSGLPLKSRALNHASLHDTAHAPRYYAMFAASSTPDFGYVNDYFARACVLGGHPADAIPFLKRAMTLRPRSVLPLLMLMDVYDRLGSRGAVDAVRERLDQLMAYRKLKPEDLETIYRNQDLDLHTWFRRDPVLMKESTYDK